MFLQGLAKAVFVASVTAGLASGATLVCEERAGSDVKLSCNLRVDYDEIASAWDMNCKPSDGGMSCNFEANIGQKTVSTPKSSKIVECSNEGVCVSSMVSTALTVKEPRKANADQQESTNDSGNIQQTQHGVKIGNYEYREPFEQYASPLGRTLRARAELWKTPPKDISAEYALANAHLDVGISHFTAVTEEDYSPGIYSESALESFDLKLAVTAFKIADKMYLSILRKYDEQKSVIYSSLAALHLQWGEVYQNSHYFDDDVEEDEGTEFNKLALERYQQAEKYYRLSLENSEDGRVTEANTKDTQVNLAHVSHRIGRCLINSIQGGAAVLQEDVPVGDQTTDQAAEALRNALPQLETLLHTVPGAEKHFAEAMRLYRTAIEDEKDSNAKVRLKLNLATTLQDAGTAASYGSNIAKAIQLQEEGVGVSKEILPHVGAADKLFLLQYVADSMYGLSNHYMQLGQYDQTKLTYKEAMEWYQKHNLGPALVAPGFEVGDDSLEAYENQLVEYRELVREITMPDGYSEDGPLYGPNDAYEADLHAALGSVHLSRDEVVMAIDHFNEAIRLYEKDESEENLDRSIANVKVCRSLGI